ncbi:MAG: cell division protein FtsZ [Armatimonadetes bacterium]|nr:cell division protein FtsZ [Armatimonadota bacterium]
MTLLTTRRRGRGSGTPETETAGRWEMAGPASDSFERIKVIGCGGGGGNAINRMVEAGLRGVEFIAINTDAQDLADSKADTRLQIGDVITKGLGAGGNPDKGREAAEQDRNDIAMVVDGADMVFITAGMGGGTGTGSAPIVAECAKAAGALTVAVVTKPFHFEGRRRMEVAQRGLEQLMERVDTLITVPNENLMDVVDRRAPLLEAFRLVDDVLRQGVQGIADLITTPGLINLDFNDVRTVMENAGSALMGIGHGSGEGRAIQAAIEATTSPLLEGSIQGARSILFNITAGPDLALSEADEAAQRIAGEAGVDDANVVFGVILDERMAGEIRITVVATGFDLPESGMKPRRVTPPPSPGPFRPSATPPAAPPPRQAPSDDDLNIPPFLRDA